MRMPLIRGHGHLRSADNDHRRRMRYRNHWCRHHTTACSKTSKAEHRDFIDNFDGFRSRAERDAGASAPLLLMLVPAIAVGWSTNIPPHNLKRT